MKLYGQQYGLGQVPPSREAWTLIRINQLSVYTTRGLYYKHITIIKMVPLESSVSDATIWSIILELSIMILDA